MGRSTTPKYVLHLNTGDGHHMTPIAWKGPATQKKLEGWILRFARSVEIGGANAHLSTLAGHIVYPVSARIARNKAGGETIVSWRAGAFQIW